VSFAKGGKTRENVQLTEKTLTLAPETIGQKIVGGWLRKTGRGGEVKGTKEKKGTQLSFPVLGKTIRPKLRGEERKN